MAALTSLRSPLVFVDTPDDPIGALEDSLKTFEAVFGEVVTCYRRAKLIDPTEANSLLETLGHRLKSARLANGA